MAGADPRAARAAQLEIENRRLRLVAKASATMLLLDDPRALVEGVLELLKSEFDLACAFNYLLDDDGARLRLNVAVGIPDDRLGELEVLQFGQAVCGTVALRRLEIVRADVQGATDPMVDLIRSLGVTAYACMPLIAGDRLIGTLSIGKRGPTEFSPDELEVMRQLTPQISLALDRRRLIRVSVSLRHRANRLQALTAALSEAATPVEVARAVVTHATAAFNAMGTVICRLSDDDGSLELLDARAMPDDLKSSWQRFPIDAPVPLADVVRLRQPIMIGNREEWERLYPSLSGMLEQTGQHSLLVMPLVIEGRAIGSMGIAFDQPRVFTGDDRSLATVVAQHGAQALERARLFEAEQRARNAAESADREKAELLAEVSHDLRTPLNAIGGYVQLLQMGVRGQLSAEAQDDLGRISSNQQRLLHLVERLLRFAALASSHGPREVRHIPVGEALAMAHDSVSPQASAKRLRLVVDPVPDDLAIVGDPERLQQILLNLLTNAVKFTPSGGVVTLSGAPSLTNDNVVCLRVRDTGPGIPKEVQSTLFAPFRQLRERNGATDGVGLGLAISRTIARAAGGDITVDSDAGKGATFTVALPRSRES